MNFSLDCTLTSAPFEGERIDPVLASLVAEGFIIMDQDIVKIT